MDVALLCRLPVGIVAWASPRPWLTAVVKATFSIAGDGEVVLAGEQRPLGHERPSALDPDELEDACDFAPQKERVDVLLVGHARAEAPSRVIPVSFTVDDVHRSFVATSSTPATAVRLSAAHLFADASPGARPVRVGPISPRSPARRTLAGDQRLDRRGLPVGALDASFDFGFFNAAPIEQQLDALPHGAAVSLTGLLAGAPRREVTLPRHRPLAYLMDAASERCITKIGLRCDTLLIDTDRAEITLVWRGAFDAATGIDRPCVLVAYEPAGTRWSNPEVRERFRRATRTHAARMDMTGAAPVAAEGAPSPAPQAVHSGHDGVSPLRAPVMPEDETATREMVRPPLPIATAEPAKPLVRPARAVTMMVEMPEGLEAWPPVPPPPPPAPPAAVPIPPPPRDEEVTATAVVRGAARPEVAPLPFRPITIKGDPPYPPARPVTTGETDGAPRNLTTGLPFRATAPEPVSSAEAPLPPPAPPHITPAPPHIASAPAEPPAPRSRSPHELLPIAEYTAIKLALSRDPASAGATLRREGFDRASWKRQEQMQVAAIEAEARWGQSLRADAVMAALGPPAAAREH